MPPRATPSPGSVSIPDWAVRTIGTIFAAVVLSLAAWGIGAEARIGANAAAAVKLESMLAQQTQDRIQLSAIKIRLDFIDQGLREIRDELKSQSQKRE